MLAAAANAGATMAGFVFYPRSPRSVTLEAAAALVQPSGAEDEAEGPPFSTRRGT